MLSKVRAVPCHAPFGSRLNYLFVCSKFYVATDRVESSCTADINMGPVVRLKDSDEVGTFRLLWKEDQKLLIIQNRTNKYIHKVNLYY